MQKYGLIGYPLKHSFSIGYFNEKFKAENIDAEYVNFEIPRIEDFMEVIEENPNLCGLNVTIPYKEQVIPYLDELDKDTAKIGAVKGTTGEQEIHKSYPQAKVLSYDEIAVAFAAQRNGNVQVITQDGAILAGLLAAAPDRASGAPNWRCLIPDTRVTSSSSSTA